jgi:hypothetical protein
MAKTIREKILDALLVRAATVAPACYAVPSYVPAELPAVTLFDGIEEGDTDIYNQQNNETPVVVESTAEIPAGSTAAAMFAQGQALIGNLVKALTSGDRTLGGLCHDVRYTSGGIEYPEDGGEEISATISLRVRWSHRIGDPWTATE